MTADYDFTIRNLRLRGVGWRGLMALGITLIFRAAALAIIVLAAKNTGGWIPQLIERLYGG